MNKQLIRTIFKEMLESSSFDQRLIEQYFSPDYRQQVDGKSIDYTDFVKHINILKAKTSSISIAINSIVAEGEIVFSNHTATTIMLDGRNVVTKVMAEFRSKDNKVYYCDELTLLFAGTDMDRDLGSKTE